MTRRDLLALTPESVASLAIKGLIQRAQREIADAAGPGLAEHDDGTVVVTFAVARCIHGLDPATPRCTSTLFATRCGAPISPASRTFDAARD